MTATEREALVDWKEALESAVKSHRAGGLDEWELHLIGRRVEAALSAPAVTVTEERCKEILSKALHPGLPPGMAVDLSHAGYIWNTDVILAAMMQAASEAALKSTTPQTGSQE